MTAVVKSNDLGYTKERVGTPSVSYADSSLSEGAFQKFLKQQK